MQKLILKFIRLYQKSLSPDTGLFASSVPVCRFSPTCSEYTYQAITKYGILHGSFLAVKRVLRCRPGHPGGSDPLI